MLVLSDTFSSVLLFQSENCQHSLGKNERRCADRVTHDPLHLILAVRLYSNVFIGYHFDPVLSAYKRWLKQKEAKMCDRKSVPLKFSESLFQLWYLRDEAHEFLASSWNWEDNVRKTYQKLKLSQSLLILLISTVTRYLYPSFYKIIELEQTF